MSSGKKIAAHPKRSPPRTVTPPGQVTPVPETPPTEKVSRISGSRPPREFRLEDPQSSTTREGRDTSDEEIPDAPSVDPSSGEDSDDDEDSSDDDEDMSDLLFEGKPGTLDDILTHCKVTFLAKRRKFPDDTSKCGHLAAKFRGKPLTWLTKNLKESPKLLDNWDEFVTVLRRDFEVSEDTKRLSADRRLKTLTQKGSAQSFAIEFDELTDTLGYEDKAKKDAFLTRLKPEVRKQLIGDDSADYPALRETAISYDEELFALRNPRPRRPGKKGKGAGPSGPGKN